jgi:Capsule assembly protein Wzi
MRPAGKGWCGSWAGRIALALGLALIAVRGARASTYVVYIPIDSPIYDELDTLDGLGLLESYLPEVRPISRVEAARLVIEARDRLAQAAKPDPLAQATFDVLKAQLALEMGWLEHNEEDRLPTMVRPVERLELQYTYSSGTRRKFYVETATPVTVSEATPLLPTNSDLPTANGNNGAALWNGWAGLFGFITGYGEGAYAGALRNDPNAPDRDRIVDGGVVVGLGNVALSFGNEQMVWGVSHFGQLAQSANSSAFPALRMQNIHPTHLPSVLRYLGLFRGQAFFGQLDSNRTFSHPWISGQVVSFKPLPSFEFGLTHTIDFGGRGNDNYGLGGFIGKATGFSTGDAQVANTNTRVSIYAKLRFKRLRGAQLYGEILGEDFYQPFGKSFGLKMPFKSPSYTTGLYLPRMTVDGLTDGRIEWTLLDKNYSTHNDSLYWTYDDRLMGYPLGPGGQRIDVAIGRWFDLRYKAGLDAFYETRKPESGAPGHNTEHGSGMELDLFGLPIRVRRMDEALADFKASTSVEYVNDVNYTNHSSIRTMLTVSIGLTPHAGAIMWR